MGDNGSKKQGNKVNAREFEANGRGQMQKLLRPCKTYMVPTLRKAAIHDGDNRGTCMLEYRCA